MRGFRGGYFGLSSLALAIASTAGRLPNAFPLMTREKRSAGRVHHRYQKLNRSQRWKSVKSYEHARSMSPFPTMPVR